MKKILFFIISGSFLLANTIEFSLNSLKLNYKEYILGKVIDSENSSFNELYGINIKFEKQIGKFILNSNLEYNRGKTIYSGSSWEGNHISFKEKNVYIYNLNFINKYNLFENNTKTGNGKIYILGGVGYRFWNRGTSDYDGDYNEQYKWTYYLLGGEIEDQFNSFDIALQAYYQQAFNPKMKAYLGNGVTYNLGKTYGYRISLPIKYKLESNYGIVFTYVYDYWKINKSNTQNVNLNNKTIATYEPDSQTKNQYLNIGFYFNY